MGMNEYDPVIGSNWINQRLTRWNDGIYGNVWYVLLLLKYAKIFNIEKILKGQVKIKKMDS